MYVMKRGSASLAAASAFLANYLASFGMGRRSGFGRTVVCPVTNETGAASKFFGDIVCTERIRTGAVSLTAVALMVATVLGPAGTSVQAKPPSASNENASTYNKELAVPLRTKLPDSQTKHAPAYVKQFEADQKPRAIGTGQITNVPRSDSSNSSGASAPQPSSDDVAVPLTRPTLQALVSIQDSFNPFSLDADVYERVGLPDALNAALKNNLDIASNFAGLSAEKYTYITAKAKFLPDLTSGYSLIGLNGSIPGNLFGANGGNGGNIALPSKVQLLSAGFIYHAYQGGKVLFGALAERHQYRASQASFKGNVNDVLLDVTKRYNDLVLNEALLDVRARAVEISEENLRMNNAQEKAGTATGLDVMQAQAQLASDQQNLIEQQQARRRASIQLATVINSSYAQDLVSLETDLKRRRLLTVNATVPRLLKAAVDNRPELKHFEELRLAAKRAIVVASAPLQPKIDLAGTVYGVGAKASNLDSLKLLNFSIKWTLGSLGVADAAAIRTAQWQAQQAGVQARKTFQSVFEQVRLAYDDSLMSQARIERANAQIVAATEELRIAEKRKQSGVGLNIDVLNAQRDLTQSRVNKARAIVDYNNSQAQLLHDTGLISIDTLQKGITL